MFLARVSSASARFFTRSKASAPAQPLSGTGSHGDLRELARRTVARAAVDFHTVLTVEALGALDARIMDISPYGFQCRARSRVLERGERAWILLPLVGECQADIMWGLKGLFGCKFLEPLDGDLYGELLGLLRRASTSISELS